MKIMRIPNMDRFLEIVQDCKGEALLQLPDNTVCNLKEDHTAVQMLKLLKTDDNAVDICFTDARDFPLVLSYMMGAA